MLIILFKLIERIFENIKKIRKIEIVLRFVVKIADKWKTCAVWPSNLLKTKDKEIFQHTTMSELQRNRIKY